MSIPSSFILVTCCILLFQSVPAADRGYDEEDGTIEEEDVSALGRLIRDCSSDHGDYNVVDGNLCNRKCESGEPPQICKFNFTVEYQTTLSPACGLCPANETACFDPECIPADGMQRGIMTVNRQMPGPSIQICRGDRILVDVENLMPGNEITIHWHGITQRETQYMDGVPMLTQCPIHAGTTFRYFFEPKNSGTYYWHSQDGLQSMDGMIGSLIVRAMFDPNRKIYGYDLPEHVIIIQDWKERSYSDYMPGAEGEAQYPDSLLINGIGTRMDHVTNTPLIDMPHAEFLVEANQAYRFRLIHAGGLVCYLRFAVEEHSLVVIAIDGKAIESIQVDSIELMPGERYDFVIHTLQPVRNYWMNVVALGPCSEENIYQNAILRYKGADTDDLRKSPDLLTNPLKTGKVLNPVNADCDGSKGVCIHQLKIKSNYPSVKAIMEESRDVVKLNISFDVRELTVEQAYRTGKIYKYFVDSDFAYAGYMNNVSLMMPNAPLLSQPMVFKELCDSGSKKCCSNKEEEPIIENFRHCYNVYNVPYGKVVEVLLLDDNVNNLMRREAHSIHMHGHSFVVIDVGGELDRAQGKHLLPTPKKSSAPYKDTVVVPSRGYARIRFRANNPGYWLLHSTVAPYYSTGMAMILKVGTRKHLPRVPKGFPMCGSYVPSINVN